MLGTIYQPVEVYLLTTAAWLHDNHHYTAELHAIFICC